MFESAFRLGSIAGIRIGVHYTWFIVFLLISTSLHMQFKVAHPDWPTLTTAVTAMLTAILFFGSIILHELGHSLVALKRGIPVKSITLFIFGGVAQSEKDADTAMTEFLVAIAGPLVSLALAGLFYILYLLLLPVSTVLAESMSWLALINLVVAIFNMVPGFPLDGGRVFRAIIWGLTGNDVTGMRWAVFAGKLVAYALMAFGMLIVVNTGLVINGLWMFGIGWFLLIAAQSSGEAFTVNRFFGEHTVREFMQHDVPMIPHDTMFQTWVDDTVLALSQRAALVRSGQGVVGLVTLSDGKKIERSQWVSTPIDELMTPVDQLQMVAPETPVAKAAEAMVRGSLNQLPVVEDGVVIGWINREKLLKTLQLRVEIES